MIEINLLPKELRVRKRKETSSVPFSIPVVPIAAGILGITLLALLAVILLSGDKTRYVEGLNAEWESIKPQKQRFDKITSELAEFEKALNFVKKISEAEVNWAKLLRGLNEAVTPGIWLSRLNLEGQSKAFNYKDPGESPSRLVLAGHAMGNSEIATGGVAKFIASLKETQDFSVYFEEIELLEMRSQALSSEDTMFFRLKCEFKKKEVQKSKPAKKKKRKVSR